jgi:hypothetical protein
MPIEVIGLDKITKEFNAFQFAGKHVQSRFLTLIGNEAVNLLQLNTPRDTGELASSWRVLDQGSDNVSVGVSDDQIEKLTFLTRGTVHTPPNPFLDFISIIINNKVADTVQNALATNHPYFADIPGARTLGSVGGRGRKRQQVGRTSAGFTGGKRATGSTSVKRAGTGRKSFGRRLSRRRRRGISINASRVDVKLG